MNWIELSKMIQLSHLFSGTVVSRGEDRGFLIAWWVSVWVSLVKISEIFVKGLISNVIKWYQLWGLVSQSPRWCLCLSKSAIKKDSRAFHIYICKDYILQLTCFNQPNGRVFEGDVDGRLFIVKSVWVEREAKDIAAITTKKSISCGWEI